MKSTPRKPFSVRLGVEEKQALDKLAKSSGLESGLIARTVLEIFLRQVGEGDSVFQRLADLELSMHRLKIKHAAKDKNEAA